MRRQCIALFLVILVAASCASRKAAGPPADQYAEMEVKAGAIPTAINPHARHAFEQGQRCFAAGEYKEAIRYWIETLKVGAKNFPYLYETHFNLGLAFAKINDHENAVTGFKKAIVLRPLSADARLNLANVYIDMGRCDLAQPELLEVVRIDPESKSALDALGVCQIKLGDHEGAISSFRRSLELQPDDRQVLANLALAHTNWGDSLYKEGAYKEAISKYEEAARLRPDQALPYFLIGRALLKLGDFDGAVAYYRKGNELDPTLAKDDHGPFLEAARSDGSDPESLKRIGEYLEARGEFANAVIQYERALEADPSDSQLRYRVGMLYAEKLGDKERALSHYHIFLAQAPDDPKAYSIRRYVVFETTPELQRKHTPQLVRVAAGMGFDRETESLTGESTAFPAGTRVYRVAWFKDMWGTHNIIRRTFRPDGRVHYEENITREFLTDKEYFLSVDRCNMRGTWRQVWKVDGEVEAVLEFTIY